MEANEARPLSEPNVLAFTTNSGSLYEIDTANKRFRRVGGANPPTARTGMDGEWKTYVHAYVLCGGVFVDWYGMGRGTLTSRVIAPDIDTVDKALSVNNFEAEEKTHPSKEVGAASKAN